MKKKFCRQCKIVVEGNKCPLCGGTDFSTNFQGRMFILDSKKSKVASNLGIDADGEYAIKLK